MKAPRLQFGAEFHPDRLGLGVQIITAPCECCDNTATLFEVTAFCWSISATYQS